MLVTATLCYYICRPYESHVHKPDRPGRRASCRDRVPGHRGLLWRPQHSRLHISSRSQR